MRQSPTALAAALDHHFQRPELLEIALTHRSAGGENNERLEFLGDSVVGMVIATELFRRFPHCDEGQLSRLRATLVKGETLAEIARELGLGGYMRLGPGELKSGGFRRHSILADALEAVFGAVYLDAGIDAARTFILRLFEARLATLQPGSARKDPKTRLQELLQGSGEVLPDYEVVATSGEPHACRFVVSCYVERLGSATRGEGASRRKAEQAAAEEALKQLGDT